ncbi:carbohydrate ABC transporter membrane protein 2, CUT1 family [Alicyclobacillus hesperidum]|uniref:Carbohydrate ABC transporter membrane protein 2, CUT1 family n=1 Tax=Alicyclobacillus hesperidum TaxID=89784 RepID=A0A1H2VXP0_9BACL|nr:sugar ABC transporter permease [Alicyclobacillus hesperidum]SDW72734.1 carbohydrate ABC transporter membrane protein 2, CUT1 family [Alicyclobacillus hesperidum]
MAVTHGSLSQAGASPRPRKRGLQPGQLLRLWISRVIIWAVIIVVLIPMWFVFTASFDPSNSYISVSFFPAHATFANYRALFQGGQFLVWVRNSLFVGLTVAIAQSFITALSAFAFSKLRFYGRKYGLMVLLLLQMFPNILSIAAFYSALAKLNMIDYLGSYILVMLGASAFNVWLLKGFMDSIPKELDEAALIDGANTWQRFIRVQLPLCLPMLVVIFFLTIVGAFGEYLFAGTILQSPSNYTLGVGMYNLISGQFAKNWGEFAAAALLSAVPLAAVFALAQKYLTTGLVAGSVKG